MADTPTAHPSREGAGIGEDDVVPLREIDGMPFTVNSRVSGRVGDLEPDGALLRHTDL